MLHRADAEIALKGYVIFRQEPGYLFAKVKQLQAVT